MSNIDGKPTTLILCDNSPLVLAGLVQLFSGDARFAVTATASDGGQFLEAVAHYGCEIGVIGWNMPFGSGKEVLRHLKERENAPRIVVHTGDGGAGIPRQAMMEGAAGFCSKKEAPERLLETVAAVALGNMVYPFMDMRAVTADPLGDLTAREAELLTYLADGITNQQIANKLGISLNTVKFHLKNLYEKLDVKNRSQAVSAYLRGS